MATSARKPKPKPKPRKRQEYQETPDYGTVFQRRDAAGAQPTFSGQGELSADTLKAIHRAGGEFQISIWTRDKDERPLRNKDGSRRFRLHIEPPWEDPEADVDDEYADDDDVADPRPRTDDDVPF